MLPAMSRATVFYYNQNERRVLQVRWTDSDQTHELIPPPTKVAIQKIRKNKTLTTWTNLEDLVFEDEQRNKKQYALSDEINNTVLLESVMMVITIF